MNRCKVYVCVFCLQGCSSGSTTPPVVDTSILASTGGTSPTTVQSPTDSGGASALPGSTGPAPAVKRHDPALFAWPESSADGGAARCKPGHYVGTYSCQVRNTGLGGDAGLTIPIDGPVDLVLNMGQSGEFLTVSGGTLKSAAAGFFQLSGDITGKLDCSSGAFSGRVAMGEVSIPPLPPGGTFTANMDGSLDGTNQSMNGNWRLTGASTLQGWWCTGPWKVTYQGP